MIVGEGRAGKTTFYRCMKGEQVTDSMTKSTCGLEESNVRFCDIEGKEDGIALNLLTDDISILDVAASKQIHLDKQKNNNNTKIPDSSNISDEIKGYETKNEPSVSGKVSINASFHTEYKNDYNPPGKIEESLINLPENCEDKQSFYTEGDNKQPTAKQKDQSPINVLGNISHKDLDISVIDYGGQNVFHCFHHFFLKPYGVYCILFDMSKFLTDELNTLYHIRYWYNSIILHTSTQTNEIKVTPRFQ